MSKATKTSNTNKKKSKVGKQKAKSNGTTRDTEEKDDLIPTNGPDSSTNEVDSKVSTIEDAQDNHSDNVKQQNDNTDSSIKILSDNTNSNTNITDTTDVKEDSTKSLSSENVCAEEKEAPSVRKARELFNQLHSGEIELKFPNRSWSIHCVSAPQRCIVISEMIVGHESETGLIPLYIKQILFDEKMNYELFLLNSRAAVKDKPCNIETVADVMEVITYINNLKLCAGGPEVSAFGNINLECAYRDHKERWRHNLCSLEVSEGDACESCVSLEDILRRHMQRNKQSAKSRAYVGAAKRKRIL